MRLLRHIIATLALCAVFCVPSHATTSNTPTLDGAVTAVQQQTAYNELVLRENNVSFSHGAIVALTALSYVAGHVSAPSYGYSNEIANTDRPDASADSILSHGAGICGHAAIAYAAIVERLGFHVRSVQFYYGKNNSQGHIADEVFYHDAWHYFDPTFGAYYQVGNSYRSISWVRHHPKRAALSLHYDDTLVWYQIALKAHIGALTDWGMETNPATIVALDQQPFVDEYVGA